MDYWYHFAIMFEALFILTTIDAGTRVARFLVQEFFGRFYPPFARTDWMPGTDRLDRRWWWWPGRTSSGPAASARSGRCSASATSCWPSIALLIGTTILVNIGRARYAWVTVVPLVFVATTTLSAGFLSVRDNFWPMAVGPDAALHVQGYLNSVLTVIMMTCVVVIVVTAVRRWMAPTGSVASADNTMRGAV